MAASTPLRILLLAPTLLGESLALQLTSLDSELEVMLSPETLQGQPQLVIWSIQSITSFHAIQQELLALKERWQPAPLLVLLPSDLQLPREQLLSLPAAGLLQNCSLDTLQEAITTLNNGGRMVRLQQSHSGSTDQSSTPTMGLGQWLLVSGLQQISSDLQVIEALLTHLQSSCCFACFSGASA